MVCVSSERFGVYLEEIYGRDEGQISRRDGIRAKHSAQLKGRLYPLLEKGRNLETEDESNAENTIEAEQHQVQPALTRTKIFGKFDPDL
jgi:hypothetical protein